MQEEGDGVMRSRRRRRDPVPHGLVPPAPRPSCRPARAPAASASVRAAALPFGDRLCKWWGRLGPFVDCLGLFEIVWVAFWYRFGIVWAPAFGTVSGLFGTVLGSFGVVWESVGVIRTLSSSWSCLSWSRGLV